MEKIKLSIENNNHRNSFIQRHREEFINDKTDGKEGSIDSEKIKAKQIPEEEKQTEEHKEINGEQKKNKKDLSKIKTWQDFISKFGNPDEYTLSSLIQSEDKLLFELASERLIEKDFGPTHSENINVLTESLYNIITSDKADSSLKERAGKKLLESPIVSDADIHAILDISKSLSEEAGRKLLELYPNSGNLMLISKGKCRGYLCNIDDKDNMERSFSDELKGAALEIMIEKGYGNLTTIFSDINSLYIKINDPLALKQRLARKFLSLNKPDLADLKTITEEVDILKNDASQIILEEYPDYQNNFREKLVLKNNIRKFISNFFKKSRKF